MHSSRPIVIAAAGLHHHYGRGETRKQALCDNHLTVRAGEIVIMTGPSGSGKTTLLALIGALRSVQEGSLQLWGTELAGLAPARQVQLRRSLGFIFQTHNLLEALTARQNVRMALELTTTPRAEHDRLADAALASVGLADRVTYHPRQLSGGQRQRVAIARALVHRPRLILADEPTAALDREAGANVVALLRRLADEQGTTVLIVTHDSRIINAADRIVHLVDGRIVSDVHVKETIVICAILRKCALFKELSPSDLTDIAQQMTEETFAAGATIIRQGDTGDKFYVVAEGSTEVLIESEGGRNRVMASLGAGDFFGEVALLRDQPRNATVVALQSVTTYALSKANFLAAMKAHRSFEEQMGSMLFNRGG